MSHSYLWILAIFLIRLGTSLDIPYVFDENSSNISYLAQSQLLNINSSSADLIDIPPLSAYSDDKNIVTGNKEYRNNRSIRAEYLKKLFDVRVEPANPIVRSKAIFLAGSYSEECSIRQICRIYDYMKKGDASTREWIYVSDPRGIDYLAYANETISNGDKENCVGVGDCDDFAVLMSALIEAIGGTTRIIVASNGTAGHAYAEVYLGTLNNQDDQVLHIINWIKHQYFLHKVYTHVNLTTKEVWLNLDWGVGERGMAYLGGPFFKGEKHTIFYVGNADHKSSLKFSNKYERARKWYSLGWNLSNNKDYSSALDAFERAIKIDPEDAQIWAGKGEALTGLHKYGEAMRAYNESIRIDPYRAYAWAYKGIALIGEEKYNESLLCFDEALRMDPGFAPALAGKSEALEALGLEAEAEAASAKARDLGYGK